MSPPAFTYLFRLLTFFEKSSHFLPFLSPNRHTFTRCHSRGVSVFFADAYYIYNKIYTLIYVLYTTPHIMRSHDPFIKMSHSLHIKNPDFFFKYPPPHFYLPKISKYFPLLEPISIIHVRCNLSKSI